MSFITIAIHSKSLYKLQTNEPFVSNPIKHCINSSTWIKTTKYKSNLKVFDLLQIQYSTWWELIYQTLLVLLINYHKFNDYIMATLMAYTMFYMINNDDTRQKWPHTPLQITKLLQFTWYSNPKNYIYITCKIYTTLIHCPNKHTI